MSALPAPPQSLKATDPDGNRIKVNATKTNMLMISDLDQKEILSLILQELRTLNQKLDLIIE